MTIVVKVQILDHWTLADHIESIKLGAGDETGDVTTPVEDR